MLGCCGPRKQAGWAPPGKRETCRLRREAEDAKVDEEGGPFVPITGNADDRDPPGSPGSVAGALMPQERSRTR